MKISNAVKAHLKTLEVKGRLTPRAVVKDAKRKNSPLHGLFKWDLRLAAEQHWLDRARELIRTVKVVVVWQDYSFRAPFYVPDPSRSVKDQGYTSLVTLKEDPTLARESLIAECERAAASLKRMQRIAAALGLEDQVEEILTRLTGFAHHVVASEQPSERAS